MTVMAAEPAAAAALATAAQQQDGGRGAGGPVVLAVAIALLWLAGFCFFIAFEGAELLPHQDHLTGAALLRAIAQALASRARRQAGETPDAGASAGP